MRIFYSVLLVSLFFVGTAQAQVKFGYVDMQRALLETADGKAARAQLEKMKEERQKQLNDAQEKLRTMQKDLEAKKAIWKPDVLQAKQQEFAKRLQELQGTYATLQKELAAEEARLTKDILERMGAILEDLGKESGDIVILEKTESRILWAPGKFDMTNELIRRYNTTGDKKKPKK